jgi:hypothetical protein
VFVFNAPHGGACFLVVLINLLKSTHTKAFRFSGRIDEEASFESDTTIRY